MDPVDYTSAFANLPAPGTAFLQGLQGGAAIQELQLKRQQEQAALAQQQHKFAVIQSLVAKGANATADDYVQAGLQVPEMGENFKRFWEIKNAAQQQAELQRMTGWSAAARGGQSKIASDGMRAHADAIENTAGGPTEESQGLRAKADQMDANPQLGNAILDTMIAAHPDGKRVIESLAASNTDKRAADLHPSAVREAGAKADAAVAGADSAESKAKTDAVEAKYAEPATLLKLEGFRSDIEFKKQQTKIAYLNAQTARETNALKREELSLQVQKAKQELDDKVRGKVADAESAAGSIDNMLNNIDRILGVAADKNGKATSTLRAAAGPLDSRLPTMQGDVADLEALVETLGSQAFLSQIPNIKGMGALSNAEGEKLQSAFQNFSLKQSPEQIIYNLREAQRLLKSGREAVSKRYGVPLGNPNTPAAGGRPPLSSFGG